MKGQRETKILLSSNKWEYEKSQIKEMGGLALQSGTIDRTVPFQRIGIKIHFKSTKLQMKHRFTKTELFKI